MNKAVFLDRDGVLNALVFRPEEEFYDSPYRLEEFRLLPEAAQAVACIHAMGMLAIVVSNQPGVAKKKCDVATLELLTNHMCQELGRQGASLDGIYYCLHHPEATVEGLRIACECRKPKPGLLRQAAQQHSIDLSCSYMVGDNPKDIQAGLAAGCRTVLLRRTPEGVEMPTGVVPHFVAGDLLSAVQEIRQGGI